MVNSCLLTNHRPATRSIRQITYHLVIYFGSTLGHYTTCHSLTSFGQMCLSVCLTDGSTVSSYIEYLYFNALQFCNRIHMELIQCFTFHILAASFVVFWFGCNYCVTWLWCIHDINTVPFTSTGKLEQHFNDIYSTIFVALC